MINYKQVKITINGLGFAEVIINIVVRYYILSNSIVTHYGSVFITKFWSLLCYILEIKSKLYTTFYLYPNYKAT